MIPGRRKFRVMLADDHPAMRESIAAAIEDFHGHRLEVVAQAADGREAIEQVRKHKPDLVVLDLGLPRLGGLDALPEIKKARPEALVLVFSMYDDQAHVVEAIRAGADDYLFKQQATPAEVARHVLGALEKSLDVQDRLHDRIFSAIRRADPEALNDGFTRLTGAELEVLKRAAHKGWSMKKIASDLSVSEPTVRKHFERVYAKLGAGSQAHAVCLAVKRGILSPDPAEPEPPA